MVKFQTETLPDPDIGARPYNRQSGNFIKGKTIFSIVTPDDWASESETKFAAEKIIRDL